MNFKKIVLAPVKLVSKGADKVQNEIVKQFILLLIRHGLTALGLSAVLSGSEIEQIIGVLGTLVGLVWSGWRKVEAARNNAAAKSQG